MTSREESFAERIARRAADRPGAVAVVETSGRRLTRRELADTVRELAAGLASHGMRPGDRALFSVRPGIDALVLILAIHEAGGVIVPIDPSMGNELFASRVGLLSPQWVFAESLLLAASSPVPSSILRSRGVRFVPLGAVAGVRFVRTGWWLPSMPRALTLSGLEARGRSARPPEALPSSADDAFIVFTSGTTGTPKGVVHTRASLDAILESVGRELNAGEDDVFYSRELHLILPALFGGARVVIPRRTRFSAADTIADIRRLGVTHLFAVTSDCQGLADYCAASGQRLPGHVRMVLIGGAPIPVGFLRKLSAHLDSSTEVWCIYGMTEMLPVARVSMHDKLAWDGEGDYVGWPVAGVEARVAPDGELIVRGAGLFSRYLGQLPVTEHATGDLARIDSGGITLLGRSKDMIIRGEYNIYPALYEPAFERLPGVRRCAMIGVADEAAADERVVVVVEPAPGIDPRQLEHDVREGLRRGEIDIDGFALPDHVFALDFPESGRSSKVDKAALGRLALERIG
jgi:long-chain acyl-CoA synthetase